LCYKLFQGKKITKVSVFKNRKKSEFLNNFPPKKCKEIKTIVAFLDWEANVTGMTGVYRLVQHHPDYLLTEHKQILQHLMLHVKNLRSQVSH
jgi:hypothetical protein